MDLPQSPTNDPVFPTLTDSIRNNNCVAVLGAGLSRPDFPTWDGLISRLQDDCNLLPDEIKSTDKLDIAEAAQLKGDAYTSALDTIFEEKPNPICQMRYHRLVRVPFKSFVTLNFDSTLVRAFSIHQNITVSEYPTLDSDNHGKREVFHIHGRLGKDRPASQSKHILGRSDFETAYDPYLSKLHAFIQSTFTSHDVCFLGCNPAEKNMAQLLSACQKMCDANHGWTDSCRPQWYMLWDNESDEPEGLESTGIHVVKYARQGSQFVGMDEILDYWADIKPPTIRTPGVQRSNYDEPRRPDHE